MVARARALIAETVSAWADDDAGLLGAGLAYYGLLSVAPLIVVVVSITSLLVGEQMARAEMQEALRDWIGPVGTRVIRQIVISARNTGAEGVAATVGTLILAWGSTRLFAALQTALNRVFGVAAAPGELRRWLLAVALKRAVAFLLVLFLGLALIASVFASSLLVTVSQYAAENLLPVPRVLLQAADFGLLCLLLTVGFSVLFVVLPDIRVRLLDVVPGAAVTAVLLVAAKQAIGWYLGTTGVASTFGAAGAFIGVLFWMVWSFQCFLLGAEFTKAWAHQVGQGIQAARGYRLVRRVPVTLPAAEE